MAAIDFPASPTNGQVFVAGNGVTYVWNGTLWLAGTTASMSSDTPPSNPTVNQLWFNSALGQLFIYYNDGNTSQWVPANPSASLPIPGVLTLYSEQVLVADTNQIVVAAPANAKLIELQWVTQCVGAVDGTQLIQAIESGTPVQTGYYGQTFHSQTSVGTASPITNGGGWNGLGLKWFAGSARLTPSSIAGGLVGDWTGWGQSSAATRFQIIQGVNNSMNVANLTGFRLVNSALSPLYTAGSFLRAFVVT